MVVAKISSVSDAVGSASSADDPSLHGERSPSWLLPPLPYTLVGVEPARLVKSVKTTGSSGKLARLHHLVSERSLSSDR